MPEHIRPIRRILHLFRDAKAAFPVWYTKPIETDLRYVVNLAMQD